MIKSFSQENQKQYLGGLQMKKVLAALLTLAMVAGMTACGSQAASSSKAAGTESQAASSQTKAVADETVTLKFGAQADSTPATQAVVDAFNSSQKKYKVEWEQFTNDSAQMHDQLLTSLSSGSSDYDIISLDVVWAGEFAAAGTQLYCEFYGSVEII